MSELDPHDAAGIMTRLREQAERDAVRLTVHAHEEMADESISYDEISDVLSRGEVVENYPEHKRGACCLICARTCRGRFVHAVCTTSLEVAIIITAYEPVAPHWTTPFERGKQK
jgi:uncharacterized protein DUF4258